MLDQLIEQYAKNEFASNDDQAVVDKLNTKTIEQPDDQQYTWAGIAMLAGPEAAEQLRVALESNGMGWAVHQFGGTGLQLTNPLVKQAVEGFIAAGIPLEPLLVAVDKKTSPALQAYERPVTLQDIADYRLSKRKEEILFMADGKINAWRSLVQAWDGVGDPPAETIGGA